MELETIDTHEAEPASLPAETSMMINLFKHGQKQRRPVNGLYGIDKSLVCGIKRGTV